MTIEDLLALARRDQDAAWEALRSVFLRGCLWACREIGIDAAEAEDMAQDGLARTAGNGFAALHHVERRVLLSAWARGVARNLAYERLRDRNLPPLSQAAEGAGSPEPTTGAPIRGWEALDLSSLTDKEQAAVRERFDGRSEREAAGKLGICRSSFRERVVRAVEQLKRAHGTLPPLPEMSRGWAEELLDTNPLWLRTEEYGCLRLYAEGRTRTEIAQELGTTAEGVHGRLGRLKRRFREGRG